MKKRVVSVVLASVMLGTAFMPTITKAASNSDIKIAWLQNKGWVLGRDGGDLALESNISRAEYVKIMVVSEGLTTKSMELSKNKSAYRDVKVDNWANGYINAATEMGLVKGDDNGNFNPTENISYQ